MIELFQVRDVSTESRAPECEGNSTTHNCAQRANPSAMTRP